MDSESLSWIAIIISIGVPIFEYFYNRYFTNINLDAQYYDEIYKTYLLSKIPEARLKIRKNREGIVDGLDEFVEILREVRKKSLYFKFANEEFYHEVVKVLQDLEDELVLADNRYDNEKFIKFQSRIDAKIFDLYFCIAEATHGKSILG